MAEFTTTVRQTSFTGGYNQQDSVIGFFEATQHSNSDELTDSDQELHEILQDDIHGILLPVTVALQRIDDYHQKYVLKVPCMDSIHTGQVWVKELLEGHDRRFFHSMRMQKDTFLSLLQTLENNYGLRGSINMSTMEALAIFINIMGHGESNRETQEQFQRSGETISRYFTLVMESIARMASDVIKPCDPNFTQIPEHIRRDNRYMPYFKDCIGAIDGTHIPASIPVTDQIPYIGRKGVPTQNVMAVCDFNLCFTFALAGWEGSAHDANVFNKALHIEKWKFPHPPPGKYYLVDEGYPQLPGYLGPYRGERYHLSDFQQGRPASGKEEIFNKSHSSLRSAIERAFGVLKMKWHILKLMPNYPFTKQILIVIAAMTLHNYVRRHAGMNDPDFRTVKNENVFFDEDTDEEDNSESEGRNVTESEMNRLKNKIANSLFTSRH